MDAISTLTIKANNEDDLETIAEFLENYGCDFKRENNTVVCEENEEFVYFDDVLTMLNNIIDEDDEIDLEITGTTDCNGNEFQDFKITYHEGITKSLCSDWYNKLVLEDMDEDDLEDLELDDQQMAEFKEKGYVYFLETEENNPRFEIELGEIVPDDSSDADDELSDEDWVKMMTSISNAGSSDVMQEVADGLSFRESQDYGDTKYYIFIADDLESASAIYEKLFEDDISFEEMADEDPPEGYEDDYEVGNIEFIVKCNNEDEISEMNWAVIYYVDLEGEGIESEGAYQEIDFIDGWEELASLLLDKANLDISQ